MEVRGCFLTFTSFSSLISDEALGLLVPGFSIVVLPLDFKEKKLVIAIAGAFFPRLGAVTGAVGAVIGAVGTLTGAVGAVTGAVGAETGAVGAVAEAVLSLGVQTLHTSGTKWFG